MPSPPPKRQAPRGASPAPDPQRTGRAGPPRQRAALSSSRNRRILQLRRWQARPERARKDGVIVVTGRHSAEEALAAGLACELVVASQPLERSGSQARWLSGLMDATWLRVSPRLLRSLSGDPSPRGPITVWRRPPSPSFPPVPSREAGRLLGLVEIQDPGNVGSLLRSALAFGASGAVIFAGTADPCHPKVIRASAGTSLRLAHWEAPREESLPRHLMDLSSRGWKLVALDPGGREELLPGRTLIADPFILLLGSEGHGLPPEVLEICDRRLRIPVRADIDSLGVAVAGALALFLLDAGPATGDARWRRDPSP